MKNSLSEVGVKELKIIRMVPLHETYKGAVRTERSFEDGLEQTVRGNLYGNSVARDVLERLLEEDGAHQVVDVVLGRGELGQLTVPLVCRDGGGNPAGGSRPLFLNHLRRNSGKY